MKMNYFKNSLEIAVLLAKTDEFGEYKSGFSAFEKWIEELKKHLASKKSKMFEEHEVNSTLFYYLLDSRQAAVRYLASMNKNNMIKRGDLIIDNYKKEIDLLIYTQKDILPSFDSGPENWTEDIINRQINILTKVLTIERETIDLIEEELKN